jgi:enoyl-CoA hydratase/carnithine racemase
MAVSRTGSGTCSQSGRFMRNRYFSLASQSGGLLLQLTSADGTNRLTRDCVIELIETLVELSVNPKPLVITGGPRFFSAGADLHEIIQLNAPDAYEFSKLGQSLMQEVQDFPAPVIAAISGYCMGRR